jgi:6-phosphogluconolactonase (cycloisomerase 2 family)
LIRPEEKSAMKTVSDLGTAAGSVQPRINLTLFLAALVSLVFVNLAPAQDNQFAYIANVGVSQVSGFKIDSIAGGLTEVPGSPFNSATSGVTSVAVDQAGGFVYATNGFASDNNVSGFRIDPLSGRLAPIPGSPFATSAGPRSVAITGSGKFAYVANQGTNNVSAFRIEQQGGRKLSFVGRGRSFGTVRLGDQPVLQRCIGI